MGLKIIIAGDREITDIKDIEDAVAASPFKIEDIDEIVYGDARGADKLAKDWADANGIKTKAFPAEWDNLKQPGAVIKERVNPWNKKKEKYNSNAGFYRNGLMADYADAVIAVQTKGYTNGTQDMFKKMKAKGKLHYVYWGEEDYEFDFGSSTKIIQEE